MDGRGSVRWGLVRQSWIVMASICWVGFCEMRHGRFGKKVGEYIMATKSEVTKIKKDLHKRNKRGAIIKALKELEEEKGGILSPYDVVAAAQAEESPLHNAFEWDDVRAGERYRLMQARVMLTTVKVEYMGERRDAYYNATVHISIIRWFGDTFQSNE